VVLSVKDQVPVHVFPYHAWSVSQIAIMHHAITMETGKFTHGQYMEFVFNMQVLKITS